jgi:cytoskeletal protein CcmA (bactofilin family)
MRAWVGEALTVQGKIISTQDLTIDGKVEGQIELGDCTLTIGLGADVKADLAAQHITISGRVTGNVTAKSVVDLRATGSIDGDIITPRLLMAEGSTIKGKVDVAGKKG